MDWLKKIAEKTPRLVIGLMSGTSADGVDAALVEISGSGETTRARLREFVTLPFSEEERTRVLQMAEGSFGGAAELCRMNVFLGELFADACEEVCRKAGISPAEVDLVGSHGQTVHHLPREESYLDRRIRSTLQIGEASAVAERLSCVVVSDFRGRDIAAGGLGAPLVPYTEYLLYREKNRTVALQNIGGIGNITLLPKNCALKDVLAFDTGPGNMVMDALAAIATGGKARYDDGGRIAAAGRVGGELLDYLLQDEYLLLPPPKTTGRESYGREYVARLWALAQASGLSIEDAVATATRFTAESIRIGVERFCPERPDRILVGGGGSHNPVLMAHIADCLPGCEVLTNEDIGLDSDAKEAVAFAVLANEAVFGLCNNAPGATGAAHPAVMGKISQ